MSPDAIFILFEIVISVLSGLVTALATYTVFRALGATTLESVRAAAGGFVTGTTLMLVIMTFARG